MGIYELLGSLEDARKGSNACDFNGYLEDYLDTLNEGSNQAPALKALFMMDHDLKIVVNLKIGVSKESISNQIIRYKDIFKLENEAVICPYIVYGKHEENEKALLLVDDDYIYAKGMYYCLTEPSSPYQEAKNDIVAVDMADTEAVKDAFAKLFVKRAGQVQRELDHRHFNNYDDVYAHCLALSEAIGESLFTDIKNSDNREQFIRSCISRWFLIKKVVYVQFMVDKNILNTRFEGNVKAQRNQAKQYADSIRFVSIAEMHRGVKEETA